MVKNYANKGIYIPSHFKMHELLPESVFYNTIGVGQVNMGWWLLDDRLLITLDALRRRYGKIIMNTWKWGGKHQYRGWRPQDCPCGAEYSQHKYGRAADMVFIDVSVDKVRQEILDNPRQFPHISAIEMTTPWLHIDCRNNVSCKIQRFYPGG